MASQASTTYAAESTPPISQLLPYLTKTVQFFYSSVAIIVRTLVSILSKVSYPILFISPLPVIIYAFSPVTVFLQIVLDALIFTPYQVTLYLLDAIYPVYVFCGVACITGILFGVGGRLLSMTLVAVLAGPDERSAPKSKLVHSTERIKTETS